ncbi:type II toxin-antitoxin system RelE/ParE family toxin [Legionella feeleii]|uniref:Toxin RelE2 n=1 Tax=Legionella feeleii TaxID=453 RepID=A0A378KJI6_9GAMM|nr:type II toxin-antitoxin system RelE/ParE family toxin [Legionella feeleii]STX88387.1 Toxin RelE2 [Legionella feeleii]
MKVKFTKLATQDLQSTKEYISEDKPSAANAIIHRVMESIENIAAFPSIGRPGRVPHTKELVISSTPLIIVYQVRRDTLFIVRVIHAARKWP